MPTFVRQRWAANLEAFGGRRARQAFAYDAYVPDPIADLEVPLSLDIAHVAAEAEVALRQVDTGAKELASLEALARQLLRAESVASSRIEGLSLSHRRLAKVAWSGDTTDVTARSVLANIAAMELAVRDAAKSKAWSVSALLRIHRQLFSAFDDPTAGHVRAEQNWIGGAASSPRDAEFVPPPADRVRPLLEDLALFIARDDLPPVIQAAVAHAQFETIHPFADGNGRVGRCLIHVVLRRRGVITGVVPPVSLVLATDTKAYVGGLTDFRAGRIAEWCATFAAATKLAALEAGRFVEQVRALQQRWRKAVGPLRAGSTVDTLLEHLPGTPVLNVESVEAMAGVSNQAARLAVAQLESAGVLSRLNAGRRNRAWEAPEVFELLNAFEQHLATRRGGTTRLRPAPA